MYREWQKSIKFMHNMSTYSIQAFEDKIVIPDKKSAWLIVASFGLHYFGIYEQSVSQSSVFISADRILIFQVQQY